MLTDGMLKSRVPWWDFLPVLASGLGHLDARDALNDAEEVPIEDPATWQTAFGRAYGLLAPLLHCSDVQNDMF